MISQKAAAVALKEAANESTVALLEPIDTVAITTADEHRGWAIVRAEVPQSELSRYPIDLRSVSHGTGSFTREPSRLDLLPADKAKAKAKAILAG